MSTPTPTRTAFTLIEVLVVIVVALTLVGLLLPAISIVRGSARDADARQTLSELGTAFELYRREDRTRRYPAERPDGAIDRVLLDEFEDRELWTRGPRRLDPDGRLLDPWAQPFRYRLTRPTPAEGTAGLERWNWDSEHDRERRWGPRRIGAGLHEPGPLPFPYLWSLGRMENPLDATAWIFIEDGN